MLEFVGRLHPLIVHLPIGLLIITLVFDLLSRVFVFQQIKALVSITLVSGIVSAMISLITGQLLSLEGTHPSESINLHKWVAFITTIGFVIYYLFRDFLQRTRWLQVTILLLLGGMITATGHLGGNLTHGENFLTQLPADKIKMIDPADPEIITAIENSGWVVSPISKEDNHLRVTGFNIRDSVTNALNKLIPIKEHITELKLSFSELKDEDIDKIVEFEKINKLWIDNTKISDAAIPKFLSLKKLNSLNLANTQVSKNGIKTIKERFPQLILHYEKDSLIRVITDTLFDKK